VIRIVYAHASAIVGGGNRVLLRLIDRLDRRRYTPISVVPEPGPLVVELEQRGVTCILREIRADRLSAAGQVTAASQLAFQLWRHAPALLHANGIPYRVAAYATAGARRICHVHHPIQSDDGLRWVLSRRPHAVITPSRLVRDGVAAALSKAHRVVPIQVVHNPIDTDWFRPAADVRATRVGLQLDSDTQHVSILGALAPHKGHDCFLRMARRVLDALPRTQFHVVGDEMEHDPRHGAAIRRLAGELGIAARVRFWGTVSDQAARDLLCASDLFVLPTKEEGFGLVVAEAQACEVPVLTSAIRPLDEVVDDGRTGYLLDPGNDAAFAEHAVRLLRDGSAVRVLGRAGRQLVQERFGEDRYAKRMTSLYDDLLAGRAPAT
jgi:glycosyltransferase involved in cell wall biosynthesis